MSTAKILAIFDLITNHYNNIFVATSEMREDCAFFVSIADCLSPKEGGGTE